MNRWIGLLNLVQAAVLAAFAQYLADRWAPSGTLFVAVAALHVLGGGVLLAGRGPGPARWACGATLAAVALVVGLHLQVAVHIVQSFMPVSNRQAYELMAGVLAALPWVTFFPLWQLLASRPGRAGAVSALAALLALTLPPASTRAAATPTLTYAEVDGEALTRAAWARWSGGPVDAPAGSGRVALAVTVVEAGRVIEATSVEGDSPAAALDALELRGRPGPHSALLVDVAQWEAPLARPALLPQGVAIARPGEDGFRGRDGLAGTMATWRGDAAATRAVSDTLSLLTVRLSKLHDAVGPITHRVRMKTWMASAAGTTAVKATWADPPALDADAALNAALAGARHIARNMREDGRYAYIVKGPGGDYGSGYNYPRHAGASWYLARVAARTGDAEVQAALAAGLDHLKRHTHFTDDGRAYVLDPTRRDGKVWVGTTGLGLLAFIEAGVEPELQAAYAAFIASSVDARGVVRGDMDEATGTWPEQPEVTYAQGQGLLALASSRRAGLPGVEEALARASAYVDGDYWPLPAANFKTLDEHWMCLAAAAVGEVTGTPSGRAVCEAYLREVALMAPVAGQPVRPPAGPAAGLAEAVIALAEIERRAGGPSPTRERALEYGRLMLDNLYQPLDAPLLGRPERLIGGFRDRPWSLDVRVDAVQHVGCALLGVEQLLRAQDLPGGMP